MCDAMRELPAPGTELFMYRSVEERVEVGHMLTVELGHLGSLRAKVLKVKPATYSPGKQAVWVEVHDHA